MGPFRQRTAKLVRRHRAQREPCLSKAQAHRRELLGGDSKVLDENQALGLEQFRR